jgi:hypothetical protein
MGQGVFGLDLTTLTSTALDAVNFYFGTGPDAHYTATCTSDCLSISTGGEFSATPEPFSFLLAGGGLLGLALLRRRFA